MLFFTSHLWWLIDNNNLGCEILPLHDVYHLHVTLTLLPKESTLKWAMSRDSLLWLLCEHLSLLQGSCDKLNWCFPPSFLLLQMMVNRTTEVYTYLFTSPETHYTAHPFIISLSFTCLHVYFLSSACCEWRIIWFPHSFFWFRVFINVHMQSQHEWPSCCRVFCTWALSVVFSFKVCLFMLIISFYFIYMEFVTHSENCFFVCLFVCLFSVTIQ